MVPAHFTGEDPVLPGLRSWLVPLTKGSSVPEGPQDGPQDGPATSG